SAQSGATCKIYQKSFCIVIQMMGGCQTSVTVLLFQFVKPIIPQFSSCQLYRQIVFLGIISGIESRQMQRQIIFLGKLFYKLLVLVALCSSQPKIYMGNCNIKF